jgi:glycosyltransferase involved in cell wall biosynthesis
MVANFRTVKDHYTLLRAWQLVVSSFPVNEQPVLCLAGAPQETYETTKRLARKLAISDNIRFLGQVKDVSGLLEASDIGVLTSEREGLPNAIVEYMAAGLAIVASDIAGNREVLGIENADLYFSVGNVTSLAERISALVRSKAKRSDQAIVHRERVRAAFSLETLCNRTLHIVEDCLAERSERRVKVQ